MAGYTPNCYRLDQVGRELGERKDTYSSLCHLVSVKWGITISILLERENVATEGGERTKQSAHYKFALTRMHVWVRACIRPPIFIFGHGKRKKRSGNLAPTRLRRIVTCIGPNQKNQPNLDLYLVRRYKIWYFLILVSYLCIGQN